MTKQIIPQASSKDNLASVIDMITWCWKTHPDLRVNFLELSKQRGIGALELAQEWIWTHPGVVDSYKAAKKEVLNLGARNHRESIQKRKQAGDLTAGYVYLVASVTGHYKIGRTKHPKDRLRTFNVKLPFEVELLCLIRTSNMMKLERSLHSRFADKRVNGEWFALNAQDVEYIKRLR